MKFFSVVVAIACCAALLASLAHAQSPSGPRLDYSTYFGGPDADGLANVAVEPGGTLLVVSGSIGGSIVRLSADGTQVLKSTTVAGGSPNFVAVAKNGTVYVAGTAGASLETVRPIQANPRSGVQGFVAVLTPDLEDVTFCTYLGGSSSTGAGADTVDALAVDSTGLVYVAGTTQADNNDFPVAHATEATYGGGASDGFVSVLDPAAPSLVFSTYFGDVDAERLTSIAIDEDTGAIYVAGGRATNPGALATPRGTCVGGGAVTLVAHFTTGDAAGEVDLASVAEFCKRTQQARPVMQFVNLDQQGSLQKRLVVADTDARDPALSRGGVASTDLRFWVFDENLALVAERMLGGDGEDVPAAIVADLHGRVYVLCEVDAGGFPLSNAFQPAFRGVRDELLVGLEPETLEPVFASFLGGSGEEHAAGMAVDILGRVTLVGTTTSSDFPTTPDAYQASLNGVTDGFVTRITGLDNLAPDYSVAADPSAVTTMRGQNGHFTIRIARTGGYAGFVTVTAPNTKPLKVKLTPASGSTTGDLLVFTFKAKKKAVRGVHELVFTASDGEGRERTAVVDLTIQ